MTAARRFSAILLAFCTLIAGCGGSVGPSPVVNDPLTITVQPASAVIYPGVATTLVITGGTGSYSVVSDNQAVVPIVSPATGHTLTVIANPVSADTVVNLSVRDTGTTPQKTVVLTVRPGTIANSITVTPASTACAPAICSGDEALVIATISQAGIPLPARGVRFDVISGDVRFITTPVNVAPEVLATTQTTISDGSGVVRVRLRVLPGAPNQTALIQITDPETLAFQRVAINIRQAPGPGGQSFFVIPESVTFTGPFANQCATSPSTSIVVFGGTPPYNIVPTSPLSVSASVVPRSGTPVTVSSFGAGCYSNIAVTITDASGRTIIATFTNQQGTGTAPPAAITLSPASLQLCRGQSASVIINGGTEPFSGGTSDPRLTAVIAPASPRSVTVARDMTNSATEPTSAVLTVTDGTSSRTATITTPQSGFGTPACP